MQIFFFKFLERKMEFVFLYLSFFQQVIFITFEFNIHGVEICDFPRVWVKNNLPNYYL